MDTKKTLPLVIAAIILAVAVIYFTRSGGNNNLSPSETQSASPSVSISASPSTSSGPDGPTSTPVSYDTPKCWLSGEIVFNGKVFMHTGTQEFNYENVHDPHDIIRWQISPSTPLGTGPSGETFSIGPNMFSGLEPIKGSDYLTISFGELAPKYKEYQLSASIDYVAVVDNAAKILNEKCSGKTTLIINK